MSNRIRYDSLLVHHLAHELDARLRGRVPRRLRLERAQRRAALELDCEALLIELHPQRGVLRFGSPPADAIALELPGRARIVGVSSPADERLLLIGVRGAPRRIATIVIELLGNQWNLLALDAHDRITAVLRPRAAGGRALRVGVAYAAPPSTERVGADAPLSREEWMKLLGDVAPAAREATLIRRVAYTSPLNAAAILGDAALPGTTPAADSDALRASHARYISVVPPAAPRPVVLRAGPALQPYPLPLPGTAAEPRESLLAALAEATGDAVVVTARSVSPELLERARRLAERLRRRTRRLRAELADAAPEAAALRRAADLLLAQAHAVPRGNDTVELDDFAGGTLEVRLDPALSAVDNAQQIYARARKREGAAERLPRLTAALAQRLQELTTLISSAESGNDVGDALLALLPAQADAARGPDAPSAPFARYRTSGGLEVRVGRSARGNDELTFHHSAPNDIWLHARAVAGAHVILRWGRTAENPPARDLAEAAMLAARKSRARTSGTVAVDWTRRKYVRKPRKARPGAVIIERARTLFVQL
ncbi:MAG: NFACT RNA binding domain-containing protein [Longimicrobiales bacterium]